MKKQIRKILPLIIALVLFVVGATALLLITMTSVYGTVTNIATKDQIKDVKVKISSKTSITNEKGKYEIKNLLFWQKKNIQVNIPSDYEKIVDIGVDYKSNKVERNIELEPTLASMVNLTIMAGDNGQYDYLWEFMHPDDKEYWGSKENYKEKLNKRDDIQRNLNLATKDRKIGENIRNLESWKSPATGKEYKNVFEVPEKYIAVDNGKETPGTMLTYYQKIEGYYHYFTQINKDELEKSFQAYENYKKLWED